MKKVFQLLIVFTLVFVASLDRKLHAQETIDGGIEIVLNNKILSDVQGKLINGHTMIPLRSLLEILGAEVEWDKDQKQILVKKKKTTVSLVIDNPSVQVNDKSLKLEQAPLLLDSRTWVPLRFLSEAFGSYVLWDDSLNSVSITDHHLDRNPLFRIIQNMKYGFMDQDGNVVIKPIYEEARQFSEGLAAVRFKGKFGFINKSGEFVIAPQYTNSYDFSEGLAAVSDASYKYGYIDTLGKVVVPFQYFYARSYSEGIAAVTDNFTGYIDRKGNTIIEQQTVKNTQFSFGLAVTDKGIIDRTGELAFPVVNSTTGGALPFSEGIASVSLGIDNGYINRLGDIVLRLSSGNGHSFSEGMAIYNEYESGKYGYINRTGSIVIQPLFKAAFPFSEGYAAVKLDNGKVRYLDIHGEFLKTPDLFHGTEFTNGLAEVELDGKRGYIDYTGEFMYTPTGCSPFCWNDVDNK